MHIHVCSYYRGRTDNKIQVWWLLVGGCCYRAKLKLHNFISTLYTINYAGSVRQMIVGVLAAHIGMCRSAELGKDAGA
jgi:hypothetical protein